MTNSLFKVRHNQDFLGFFERMQQALREYGESQAAHDTDVIVAVIKQALKLAESPTLREVWYAVERHHSGNCGTLEVADALEAHAEATGSPNLPRGEKR